MPPKFGTSGLRGLVTELTDELVADYARAFATACDTGNRVWVGWDLRPSSPRIAEAVISALNAEGLPVVRAGMLPTPALALAAMSDGSGAVMVTGSHIPADRNGLKFYVPEGEIAKSDEERILGALGRRPGSADAPVSDDGSATEAYVRRYEAAFGSAALTGLRIGVYEHSSAARDILTMTLRQLGAETVPLARSDSFVPVDTEAVDADTRAMLQGWCLDHGLDALVSTDGDADRPMVTDETGRIVPGDVLGPLTAGFLGAQAICTPVSSNTCVEAMGFGAVHRTKIGSPHVIAEMERVAAEGAGTEVVGYEANGGFLLGFCAKGPAGPLAPLMTRDSLLPILAPLARAKAEGRSLSELVATLPRRFTAADRITGIESEDSQAFLRDMTTNAATRAAFFEGMPPESGTDTTDGLRVSFEGGDIVHLRPSGNAPEFRCYAESSDPETAERLVGTYLAALKNRLS
ncbi:phosphomannomutase [Histidinibacterium aquaticum]|uniref:Phosphomannomutase n=1 Tax=Histidinibacterium aquaticum TaxID=2613962 RepID=A0A5J5GFF6_9RHOB|nr:phosphomannomutase [Histidinibacterium aquaticum]KAA9006797.1 phosphomannomutase [Histidinibacterium aquaticum]